MNKNNTLEDNVPKEPATHTTPVIAEAHEEKICTPPLDARATEPECTAPTLLERTGARSFRWADIEEDDDF